jgi:nucleoside-diphosphate-sugar epimerase
MNQAQSLSGKNILVTGATGFIGGRLVEYLVSYCHANVRALVRNYGKAVRIARLPVQLVPGDLMNLDSLRGAAAGCVVVFHCAAGISGEDDERRAATVDGTRNMLEAASEAGVKRFVHISSAAVYGPDPGPWVDETTPLVRSGNLYADAKLEADQMVARFGVEKGLPVVILRPTIVYGPGSGAWTISPVNRLLSGTLELIDGGQGLANQVYVDDVVQAMLLAAVRPEAVGEAFVISNGTAVTWKAFFGCYARMLGSDSDLPDRTLDSIDQQVGQFNRLRNPFYMGMTFLASPHANAIIHQVSVLNKSVRVLSGILPKRIKESILSQAASLREIKLNPPQLPDPWTVKLYTAKGVCKIDHAQQKLGYQPQVSFTEGMQYTEAWLRHIHLIPGI